MSILPHDHPARLAVTGAAGLMEIVSFAFNVAATLACTWLALKLWGDAKLYLANAGGFPVLSLDYAWRLVQSPGLHLRAMWWALSWACAVFAVGAGLLALAGARSVFWRIHAAVKAI